MKIKKKILILSIITIFALVIVGYFGYKLMKKKRQREQARKEAAAMSQVLNELGKIPLEEPHLAQIISKKCKTIEKSEDVWTVKDCSEGIYFKIFLGEGGYIFGPCADGITPREVFLKVKDMLSVKECADMATEDKLLWEAGSQKMYGVCGIKILVEDNCIIGVGK